jgi:hypothetical protein
MAPDLRYPDCWSALTGSIASRTANIHARAVFLTVQLTPELTLPHFYHGAAHQGPATMAQ